MLAVLVHVPAGVVLIVWTVVAVCWFVQDYRKEQQR